MALGLRIDRWCRSDLWHNYTNLDILVAAPPCMPTSPPVLGLFLHSRDRRVTTDGAGSTIPAPGFSGKTLRAPPAKAKAQDDAHLVA